MGIFDGGLAVAEGLRAFGGVVSNVGPADEVHALWHGVRAGGAPGGRCALRWLVRRQIRRGQGTAVWFDYWRVRRMHPPDFESCHHEHGYETRTGDHSKYRDRVGVGGPRDRSGLQTASAK